MKNLLKWLRPKEDEDGLRALLRQADETIEREKAKSSEFIEKYQSATLEIGGLMGKAKVREERITELFQENQELSKQLREQAEADVYLEAAKIVKRIESGEKVTAEDEAYKKLLQKDELIKRAQARAIEAARAYQSAERNTNFPPLNAIHPLT